MRPAELFQEPEGALPLHKSVDSVRKKSDREGIPVA